jgi:Dr1-associated corepressor
MSEDPDSYRPKSPDLSAFVPPPHLGRIPSYQAPADTSFPPGYSFSPRGSYDASPYFSPQNSQPSSYFGAQPHSQGPYGFSPSLTRAPSIPTIPSNLSQQHSSSQSQRPLPPTFASSNSLYQQNSFVASPITEEMPRTRAGRNVGEQDADYDPNNAAPSRTAQPNMPSQQAINATPAVDPALTVDVRTKFPVARIKRIMQADEDVGKVAQATPTAVGTYCRSSSSLSTTSSLFDLNHHFRSL